MGEGTRDTPARAEKEDDYVIMVRPQRKGPTKRRKGSSSASCHGPHSGRILQRVRGLPTKRLPPRGAVPLMRRPKGAAVADTVPRARWGRAVPQTKSGNRAGIAKREKNRRRIPRRRRPRRLPHPHDAREATADGGEVSPQPKTNVWRRAGDGTAVPSPRRGRPEMVGPIPSVSVWLCRGRRSLGAPKGSTASEIRSGGER